jgi:hypothetical protein
VRGTGSNWVCIPGEQVLDFCYDGDAALRCRERAFVGTHSEGGFGDLDQAL